MTIFSQTPSVYTESQLDFRKLVLHLSLHKSFPCSLHIRNLFLAQYCANVDHPALRNGEASVVDPDPWRTLNDFRPGVKVFAVGDVPQSILSRQRHTSSSSSDSHEGLWSLVVIYPYYSPGWEAQTNQGEREDAGVAVNIWLSTETHATSLHDVRQATLDEVALLRFIVDEHLVHCAYSVVQSVVPSKAKEHDAVSVAIMATNQTWILALQQIAQSSHPSPFRFIRSNPCLTYTLSEADSIKLAAEEYSARWIVGSIEAKDIDMVQSTNNIGFSRWYVRNNIHRSVMVSDGERRRESSTQVYPSHVDTGAPAGWAYLHHDLAVASLHVTEPYRRNRDVDGGSVGRVCLGAIALHAIEAQKRALSTLFGPDEAAKVPTPLLSDTEMNKGTAQAFHKKFGFRPFSVSTWGAIAIDPNSLTRDRVK